MKKTIIIQLVVLMLSIFSCKNDGVMPHSGCGEPVNVDFKAINFSDSCQIIVMDAKTEDKYLIINSKQELQEKISFQKVTGEDDACNKLEEQFNIDFNEYTLLIGKKRLTAIQGQLIEQHLVKNCETGKYLYKVKIKNGGYTMLGNFIFGVLVPKSIAGANPDYAFEVEVVD